jgi:lipid II:glycine glycyltransferase (peptidoglycan interpeptide bridge formation enzyme)
MVRSCTREDSCGINTLVDSEEDVAHAQRKNEEYLKKLDEIYKMKAAITEAVLLDLPEKSKKIANKRLKIKLKKAKESG